MIDSALERLKFPTGKFVPPVEFNQDDLTKWIDTIERFPKDVSALVLDLSTNDKQWVYRPGGWNIQEVVHHCADSHMNAFIRFKLTLTENVPTILPYRQDEWVKLPDAQESDLSPSLFLLIGLHHRWATLLKSLNEKDLQREYIHPEYGKHFSLYTVVALYAWHCRHHLAHIEQAIEHKGVFV